MAKKRFIVKAVKTCWRSSMIAGNPITRKFIKYGVYDRDWQDEHCYWVKQNITDKGLLLERNMLGRLTAIAAILASRPASYI